MIKSKVQQNVKYDSETGKVYEELGSSGSGNSCNPPPPPPPPSTSESNALLVHSATSAAAMVNGGSAFQNGASFQARNIQYIAFFNNWVDLTPGH